MAVSIADLFVTIGADASGALAGLGAVDAQVKKTADQFKAATPAAALLAGAGAAVGAGFFGAAKQAASFEQAMANVRAVMSPSEAQQFGGALDDLALSLGEKTSFNALQVAGGLKEMLKAGFSVEDVMGGAAQGVLNLAAATDTGVTQSATLAAQSMNAFGLSVQNLPGIVDTLAGVSVTTAADMNDMSQALSDAGVTAHGMGLSFLEFSTAIGIFRQAGVSANASGTALKTMLTRLVPNTKAETSAFKNLGLITEQGNNVFFDAQGHFLGMANASQKLKQALGGMSEEQRTATVAAAFGTEAIQGINALIDQGADGFNKYARGIAQISATEEAAARINTLFGALDQLGGALQTASIVIGRIFDPTLRAIVQRATEVVQAFNAMSPSTKALAVAIAGIAGAVASGIGGLVLLVSAARIIAPSFVAVGRVLALLSPIILALAATAAVLAAAWATNLFGIRDKVAAAFEAIPGILDQVSRAMANAGNFWESTIVPTILTIANVIERTLLPVFNAIASGPLQNLGLVFQKVFAGDISGAVDTFQGILGALVPGIAPILVNVRNVMTGISTAVADVFARVGPILGNLNLVFQKIFAGDIRGAVDTFIATVSALVPGLGTIIQSASAVLGGLLQAAKATFDGIAAGPLGNLGLVFQKVLNSDVQGAADTFIAILGAIVPGLGPIVEGIRSTMAGVIAQVVPIISNLGLAFQKLFAGDFSGSADTLRAVIGAFAPELGKLITQAEGAGQVIGPKLGAAFSVLGTAMDTIAAGAGVVLLDFFSTQLPAALQEGGNKLLGLGPVFSAVGTFFGGLGAVLVNLDSDKLTAFANTFGTTFSDSFSRFGSQLSPLIPVFVAIGGFASSLNNLILTFDALKSKGATGGDAGDQIVTPLQRIVDFFAQNGGALTDVSTFLGPVGGAFRLFRDNSEGIALFFDGLATALDRFSAAIKNLPQAIPPWLQPFLDKGLLGGAQATGAQAGGDLGGFLTSPHAPPESPLFKRSSFGGGDAGGPLVWIGQIIIGSEAEKEAFLQSMAETIRAAAGRVSPPLPPGQPGVVTGVI